jgi:hypothetical protein
MGKVAIEEMFPISFLQVSKSQEQVCLCQRLSLSQMLTLMALLGSQDSLVRNQAKLVSLSLARICPLWRNRYNKQPKLTGIIVIIIIFCWPSISCGLKLDGVLFIQLLHENFLGFIDFLMLWQQDQATAELLVVTHSWLYGFTRDGGGRSSWGSNTHVSFLSHALENLNILPYSPKGSPVLEALECLNCSHWVFDMNARPSQGRKSMSWEWKNEEIRFDYV